MPSNWNALAGLASSAGANRSALALNYYDRAWRNREQERQDFQRALHEWKQKRAARKAEAREDSEGGLWGAGGGAALGLVLAPFTGGASLALVPALAGAGGAIGGAFDDPSGFNAQQFSSGLQQVGSMVNPYFKGGRGGTEMTQAYNPWMEAMMEGGGAGEFTTGPPAAGDAGYRPFYQFAPPMTGV